MNINVKTLREALALLRPAVPRKTPLPACEYILVGQGMASADDMEVRVSLDLPEADGPPLCFPRQALDFLEGVPGYLTADISMANNMLSISVGTQTAAFHAPNAEDFPPLRDLDAEHDTVCDGDNLVHSLTQVAPYSATDESRPVLTGICLTLGEKPRVSATNGFRLAWEPLLGRLPGEGNLVIPSQAIKLLTQFWKQCLVGAPVPAPEDNLSTLSLVHRFMRLAWKDTTLRINFGGVTLHIRLIDGTYPDYDRLIPQDFSSKVSFMAEDLYRVLRSMERLARENSGICRLEWQGDTLTVSVLGQDNEIALMKVPAQMKVPSRIAFNHSYLTQYLAGKQGAVTMSVTTPSSPATFEYHGRVHHLIMPMFVRWEPDASAAPPAESSPDDFPFVALETSGEVDQPEATPEGVDQPPVEVEAAKPKSRRKKVNAAAA